MKMVVMRSLVIAVVLGVVVTAVSSVLVTTFRESSAVLGVNRTLTGYEAISATIDAFGIIGYIKGLLGTFVLFFSSIFIAALWQGAWMLRKA